ncbi:CsbD family protein [Variovorax sp. M-6]|uniref:CsbD family protein n=1 Tax=Variovorax sp. M-6 TaxID=3233041 RepID=UPI003F991ED8
MSLLVNINSMIYPSCTLRTRKRCDCRRTGARSGRPQRRRHVLQQDAPNRLPRVPRAMHDSIAAWLAAARPRSIPPLSVHLEGIDMNKDQVKGTLEKAKGSVKETVGKAVGNERLQAEGSADKVAGAVQKKVGDVKDAVKTVAKKP